MIGLFNFPLRQQPDGTLVSSGPISAPVLSPSQQVPILPKLSAALGSVMAQVADAEFNLDGDSTTYGYYGISTAAMPLQETLKGLFPANIPVATGWIPIGSPTSARDARYWSIGAGWNPAWMGFGMRSGVLATNPANPCVFTGVDYCDTFDVMFAANTGLGTAQIQATGGVAVPVNTGVGPGQLIIGTCSAASLAKGNTVTVTGSGQIIPIAARGRNSTKKQLYINGLGIGQSSAKDWASASSGFASVDALAKTSPCLSVVMLGINDSALAGMTLETFKTNYTNMLATFPATGDLIIAAPIRSNPALGSGAYLALQVQFTSWLKELSTSLGVRFIPVGDIIGDYSAANYADDTHCKMNKYPEIALAYYRTMFL